MLAEPLDDNNIVQQFLKTLNINDSCLSNDSYERAYVKSIVEAQNVKEAMTKGAVRYIRYATTLAIILSYAFGMALIVIALLWLILNLMLIFYAFSGNEAGIATQKFIIEIETFFKTVVPPVIAFIVGYISKPNKKVSN